MLKNHISEAITALQQSPKPVKAFVALDGYIDRIQKVVASTNAANERQYYHSLDAFGKQIQRTAGMSSQMEIVSEVIKLGGNAPIMAEALATLDIPNRCLGTFGATTIHSVFQVMHEDVHLVSIGDAATTNALEFDDGKLMLSEVAVFEQINWSYIKEKIGIDHLVKWCQEVDLIALVDWTNLPYSTSVWRGLLEEVIIPNQIEATVFFDLCDPKKKTDKQILEVLNLINAYGDQKNLNVVLGLNENEAIQVYACLKRAISKAVLHEDLAKKCQYIFDNMHLHSLVVHPIDSCYLVQQQQSFYLRGKLVEQPKISTGGGDNFNAGFCYGLLNDLSPEGKMLTAMATSGAYVQNGASPSKEVLIDYLKTFQN
jgi:sugar/nucleoside kinase (ribokinase family)